MKWGRLSDGVARKIDEMKRELDTCYLAFENGIIDKGGFEYIAAFRAATEENTPEDLHDYRTPDEMKRITVDVMSSAAREVSEATGQPVEVVYKLASMYARLIETYELNVAQKN